MKLSINNERLKLEMIELMMFNLLQLTWLCLPLQISLKYSSLSRAKSPVLHSWMAVNSSPLLLASFTFTKWSAFDWGLKVSFGVFLLKHLWLQLCGQKLTIKPWTPLEIAEIFFYQASEHPFSFRGLKCFHVCNNFVYSVCIHTKLRQGDNKPAANCSWWG